MRKTPLENWISHKISGRPDVELTPNATERWQLERVRQTVEYVSEKSPFYRRRLAGLTSRDLRSLQDIAGLPFTTNEDLAENGSRFLCVSQSDVERVVTLQIPGGTAKQRRISFSGEDLELTTDFFHHGMTTLVEPGRKVLILMPGETPGSVGDLLAQAVTRAEVEAFPHGVVQDPSRTIRVIRDNGIDCLVGIPTQVLSLARHEDASTIPAGQIRSVLLSADYVPSPLADELKRIWTCDVFNHYGTTEMGLGGGVECEAFSGYHLREADLLVEIVDPLSGRTRSAGQRGEIVFTTLTRKAMPLLRYRTGDLSRFLPEPCLCGTVLKRLEKVRGKVGDMVHLRTGDWFGIADLDEALFSVPGIVNFAASLTRARTADRLGIEIYPVSGTGKPPNDLIEEALLQVPTIATAIKNGHLFLDPIGFTNENAVTTGVAKRAIVIRDKEE